MIRRGGPGAKRRARRRRDGHHRGDLLRGIDAEAGDLREALHGVLMRREQVGDLLWSCTRFRVIWY
jgi:hypothetical protein